MDRSYGWVIVACGFLITCIGMGSMMALSAFLQPMALAMEWSRAGISMASLLNFVSMGLASFAWGALSDRYGTRIVVLIGGVILGTGLALASQTTSLLTFQILFGVLVGIAAGSFYAPLIAMTSGWFTHHRAIAVALVSAGMSIGSASITPLARWLIDTHDWRFAMLALAVIAWAILLPVGLLLRQPPAPAAGSANADTGELGGLTVAEALRTPHFAAIALTHFACCAAHSGPIFHMVTYAIDCGIPAMAAASIFGTAGLSALAGRIIFGLIADRVGAKPTLIAGLTLQAVSVGLYIFVNEPTSFYLLAAMFGFSYGGVMPLYALLVRSYFGARIMGSMFGAVAMISTLGMAIGPWAGGYLFDTFGSYFWLYLGSFGIGTGAVVMAFLCAAPPPRRVAAATAA